MPKANALDESRRIAVHRVSAGQPLRWLARGIGDLWRCPWPGLLHGLAAGAFGALLILVAGRQFWWLAGAFSGFLIVAPVFATGLYAVSRAMDRGEPAGLGAAWQAWVPKDGRLVTFGLLLALAGTGWVLTSAGLITGFAGAPVRNPVEFVRVVVLAPSSWLFETWLVLGAVLAAPVFASSVVAIPLLLDRPVSVAAAVYTSWRVVLENPLPMALWAVLIMLIVGLGFATLMAGLVVVVPLLAHASWHAYRDLVAPAGGA